MSPKRSAPPAEPVTVDPALSARIAGLRYVHDDQPGITRRRLRSGWRYTAPDGTVIREPDDVARINRLAIPPAYTDVWICPNPRGHLQATGRDARGRKQYRYHPKWREVRDQTKYNRMLAFGDALPRIRGRIDSDLSLPGLCREKILATVVRLLDTTYIRIGNEEYARENNSVGLTTMQDRNVEVAGTTVRFRFRGKHGKDHDIDVRDRRVARIIARCQELPGHDLFQYADDEGTMHPVQSGDVNAYLHDISGDDFTAKDFRTWGGTILAAWALQELGAYESEYEAKRHMLQAIDSVAKRLGNTPTICRKCYIHPEVLNAHIDGTLLTALKQRADEEIREHLDTLSPREAAVVALLRRRLTQAATSAA